MKRYLWRTKSCIIVLASLLLVCGCARDGDQAPLFQDDFADAGSGWGAEQREEFERGYQGGEYFIELYESNWFAWAYPGERFDDVSIEADVYLASGAQDSHFGLLCRHTGGDNFYYFAVSADGYYGIFRRVDGGGLEVLTAGGRGMAFSPAIRTGEQTNHVMAVCRGDELSLYVNGELLETVTDEAHTRGDVGVGAGSGPEGAARVQFDNFTVTTP